MDKKSRLLTKILRHKLIEFNLLPDRSGYVKVDDIRNTILNLSTLTDIDVKEIVKNDNKGRFGIKELNNILYIRANQGHSANVGNLIDDTKSMNIITQPIENVFHGTYTKNYDSICKTGLNRGERKHIHIAKSLDAKSGKRHNCDLLVYIDMKGAMEDGIIFYESQNGVILTEGKDSIISPKYLSFKFL